MARSLPSSPGVSGSSATATSPASGQALQQIPDFPLLPDPQRTGHRPHGRRLRQSEEPPADLRLHVLHRPGRDQHDHRRGGRDHQPPARSCSLPGDIFARRNVAPVLQQLESPNATQDISVNDCFKPVSRYWDRINRPDQLLTALPEAMRVLTSPVRDRRRHAGAAPGRPGRGLRLSQSSSLPETGLVTCPATVPTQAALQRAAELIRASRSDR